MHSRFQSHYLKKNESYFLLHESTVVGEKVGLSLWVIYGLVCSFLTSSECAIEHPAFIILHIVSPCQIPCNASSTYKLVLNVVEFSR